MIHKAHPWRNGMIAKLLFWPSGQDPLTLEEVTKFTKTMANDITKLKQGQGQAAHSFVGLFLGPRNAVVDNASIVSWATLWPVQY